jgi:uncharacterized membrane protein YeaQ/YmgE (transglycosylase-associated protein family)
LPQRAAAPQPAACGVARRRFSAHSFEDETMGIFGFIKIVVVGFIVGAIARWIMPGAQAMGWILTSLVGIGGAVVGGLVSSAIWKSPDGRFHPAGWIMSVLGALVVLWAYMQLVR